MPHLKSTSWSKQREGSVHTLLHRSEETGESAINGKGDWGGQLNDDFQWKRGRQASEVPILDDIIHELPQKFRVTWGLYLNDWMLTGHFCRSMGYMWKSI